MKTKKIIPTAILGDHSENIGIESMTVRYTQRPDCNDPSQDEQYLTIEAVTYDDSDEESALRGKQCYYLTLSTERWAIESPAELTAVVEDFMRRLQAAPEAEPMPEPKAETEAEHFFELGIKAGKEESK